MADNPLAYSGADEDTPEDMADEEEGNDYFGVNSSVPAAGGLAALDMPGAAEALQAMAKSSAEARAALQKAREQIVARRYSRSIPLLAISAALGKPTRTGSFGETLGNVSESLIGPVKERSAFEQARQKELLGIDTQVAGLDQNAAQAQLQLAVLKAKLANQAAVAPNEKYIGPDGKVHFITRAGARDPNIQAWTPPAPSTNVTLNTDKQFFGSLGQEASKMYMEQFQAALKAPSELERNARIRALLKSGAYTGMGANFKLGLDRALNAAHIDFGGDKIANTEQLVSELSAGTLALIKPSGLGGGTGFSNADREFIQKVAGGDYTLNRETLERLSKLHDRAQRNVLKTWNSSYSRIAKVPGSSDQLAILGMTPLDIPAEEGAAAVTPPASVQPPGADEGDEPAASAADSAPAVAPPEALAILKANPTPETKAYFLQTFGYLPDGYK